MNGELHEERSLGKEDESLEDNDFDHCAEQIEKQVRLNSGKKPEAFAKTSSMVD